MERAASVLCLKQIVHRQRKILPSANVLISTFSCREEPEMVSLPKQTGVASPEDTSTCLRLRSLGAHADPLNVPE